MIHKLYIVFAGLILLCTHLMAQAPNALNYQGVARDVNGNILPNQPIALRFTIHEATAAGTTVYQETWLDTTNQFGLFTVHIGEGTVTNGTFSTISWGTSTYFLQVEMDPKGGINYIDMGTQQFISVPYALYAQTAGIGTVSLTQNQIAFGNSNDQITSSSDLVYNGNQIVLDLVDSWGCLKVEGRNGGEGSIQIKPDNIADGTAGSWVIGTNGTVMNNPNDWALYNAKSIPQPIYVTQSTNAVTFDKAYTFPTVDGVSGQVLTTDGVGNLTWATPNASSFGGWSLTGNSGTTAGTNFIGTIDAKDFVIKTTCNEHVRVLAGGNVGIATSSPAQALEVGNITNTIRVDGLTTGGAYNSSATSSSNLVFVNKTTGDFYALPNGNVGAVLGIAGGGVPTWVTAATLSTPAEALFTPTNGAAVTTIVGTNIINPSGSIAALTISLPSLPTNGQCVELKFTNSIASITYSGGMVASAITSVVVGTDLRLFYDSGTSTWY